MFANLGSGHRHLALACGYGLLAALGVALFWGFTVDDALVTARVAWRIGNGFGYRFNSTGPAVDTVTPLGWVYFLVPFARNGPLSGLAAARWFGAACWILGAMWLGYSTSRDGKRPNSAILALVAPPLGVWATAGMETGVILGLGSVALGSSSVCLFARCVIASWRPEMLPFCMALGSEPLWTRRDRRWGAVLQILAPAGAFAGVAAIRRYAFGSALPLAAIAKPSDVVHGFSYALSALLFLGPPLLLVGPGWRRLSNKAKSLLVAVAAHWIALIASGGDWMALWRLAVPAIPALLLVAHDLLSTRRGAWVVANVSASVAVMALVGWQVGWPARHVLQSRLELIRDAKPLLRGARLTAGLDVGWIGATTPNDVLDLAGITDPRVAAFPGGHTTKRIPNSWFDSRQPDALVLLTAPGHSLATIWWETRFARAVENRVATLDYWQSCSVEGTLPLRHTRQHYVFVRCRHP